MFKRAIKTFCFEYRFLSKSILDIMSNLEDYEILREPKDEAPLYRDQLPLFIQYGLDTLAVNNAIEEITFNVYVLTMKPLDLPYKSKAFSYHQRGISKGIDLLKKRCELHSWVATTEIHASKIHQNIVFRTKDKSILQEHDKIWSHKWKICVEPLKKTLPMVLSYIFKECEYRWFHLFWDYNMSPVKVIRRKPEESINSSFLIDIGG